MIINFLQTCNPPILPSLQQQPNLKRKIMNGIDVTFDKDVNLYKGFGKRNKESLGQLLFHFFRCYGHELDFETSVLSVRLGRTIPKTEKGWNLLQDNRLCVEEPFNTSRNLGNTADDTSMRGIHLELRRAFKMVAEANLEKCCEQYEYPLDEGRTFEKFTVPESRPIIAMPPPARGGRNASRGGRHATNRGANNSNRRTSNSARNVHPSLRQYGYPMSPQEHQLFAQQQQFALHNELFQQYQYLQAQEQELRQMLHQQAFLQGRVTPSMPYPHIAFPAYTASESGHEETDRVRAQTVNHPHMTAPVRQQRFPGASPYLPMTMPRLYGPTTNPPSPHLRSAVPDLQRASRHASMTDPSSTSSLRAHSQPARPMPSPLSFQPIMSEDTEEGDASRDGQQQYRRPSATSNSRDMLASYFNSYRRPSEYVGYYIGHSPPVQARSRGSFVSPLSIYSGLAIHNGGLSPHDFAQIPSYQSSVMSPPPERAQTPADDLASTTAESGSIRPDLAESQTPPPSTVKRSGPLVINGSTPMRDRHPETNGHGLDQSNATTFSASTSEDLAFDTPTSSEDHSQGLPETIDSDLPLLSVHSHPEPIEGNAHPNAGAVLADRHGVMEALRSDGPPFSPSTTRLSTKGGKMRADQRPVVNGIGVHPVQVQATTQLSPVRETPNLSPRGNGQAFDLPQVVTNGIGKPKAMGRQERMHLAGPENQPQKDGAPSMRANGASGGLVNDVTNGANSGSGWQTAKKRRHKKSVKSESDINPANILGGDLFQKEQTLRKGG